MPKKAVQRVSFKRLERSLIANNAQRICSKAENLSAETCGKLSRSARLLQTLSSFTGCTSIQHTSFPTPTPPPHIKQLTLLTTHWRLAAAVAAAAGGRGGMFFPLSALTGRSCVSALGHILLMCAVKYMRWCWQRKSSLTGLGAKWRSPSLRASLPRYAAKNSQFG